MKEAIPSAWLIVLLGFIFVWGIVGIYIAWNVLGIMYEDAKDRMDAFAEWVRRSLILGLIVFALQPLSAQSLPVWKCGSEYKAPIVSMSFAFLGGCARGIHDGAYYHYPAFKRKFPNSSDWWNPETSWERKYKDWPIDTRPAFPGAKGPMAWVTDQDHFFKAVDYGATFASAGWHGITVGVNISNKHRRHWSHYALDALLISASRSAGAYLWYDVIIR